MVQSPAPSSLRAAPALASAVLVLAWLGALQVLWRCLQVGGHKWLQGDWLINLAAGPVRRGVWGQALLAQSDVIGVGPVTATLVVQGALATALFGGTLALVLRQRHAGMAVLVLSGGFFALLWSADALAGFRKELIGLVALVLLALPGAATGRVLLSAAVLVAGAWGHEIGVLMLPAWGVMLWLLPPRAPRWGVLAIAGLTAVLVLCAGAFALAHPGVAQTGPICAAITLRQSVHPDFCNGAIGWLGMQDAGLTAVKFALAEGRNAALLPVAFVMIWAPVAYLFRIGRFDRRLMLAIFVAVAPVFLLYPIALDWGRWMSLQVTIASLLLLGLGAAGRLPPVPNPRPAVLALWLVLACASGLQTVTEILPNALISRLVNGFAI